MNQLRALASKWSPRSAAKRTSHKRLLHAGFPFFPTHLRIFILPHSPSVVGLLQALDVDLGLPREDEQEIVVLDRHGLVLVAAQGADLWQKADGGARRSAGSRDTTSTLDPGGLPHTRRATRAHRAHEIEQGVLQLRRAGKERRVAREGTRRGLREEREKRWGSDEAKDESTAQEGGSKCSLPCDRRRK